MQNKKEDQLEKVGNSKMLAGYDVRNSKKFNNDNSGGLGANFFWMRQCKST